MNFEDLIYNFPDSKKMCLRYYLFNPQLTQIMENEQQNITHTVPNLNQQRAMQFPLNMNFDKMTGQQESSFVASQLPVSHCNPNLQHLNVDILTPSKPSSSHARYFKNEPVWCIFCSLFCVIRNRCYILGISFVIYWFPSSYVFVSTLGRPVYLCIHGLNTSLVCVKAVGLPKWLNLYLSIQKFEMGMGHLVLFVWCIVGVLRML